MDRQDAEKEKAQTMNYGDLAFWIYLSKRILCLPDNISLGEFYSILLKNKNKNLVLMEIENELTKDNPARDSS